MHVDVCLDFVVLGTGCEYQHQCIGCCSDAEEAERNDADESKEDLRGDADGETSESLPQQLQDHRGRSSPCRNVKPL